MDGKQFEEIMITLTDIASRISLGFERLKNSIEINDNKSTSTEHDDLEGIPLDSVHHPRNSSYINNPNYMWNNKQNMWRPKR